MNASQMTFGLEIECQIPTSVAQQIGLMIGGYHRGIQVPGLPTGWTAQSDASIGRRAGHISVEIVSPILMGREGIEQVLQVVCRLNEWRARVDRSCGVHVHVGCGLAQNMPVLQRLLHLTAKFERALFAVTGTKSREHGHYAAPMTQVYESLRSCCTLETINTVSRYHSLNLRNLLTPKGTVEFRVFQGSTNAIKIVGYIQICLGLCENAWALRRKPSDKCRNVRHQDGRGLVYRMLRNFNWYSEKRMGEQRFGLLQPETLDLVKAEMIRLAKKYDSDTRFNQHGALRPVVMVS